MLITKSTVVISLHLLEGVCGAALYNFDSVCRHLIQSLAKLKLSDLHLKVSLHKKAINKHIITLQQPFLRHKFHRQMGAFCSFQKMHYMVTN